MTDYKLVPVFPTPEMLAAVDDEAEDKYVARGRAVSAYLAMLDAAPAVQGEPVVSAGWAADAIRDAHLEGQRSATGRHHSLFRWNNSESHAVFLRLLSGSQPAEQQPAPDVAGLVEALEQCITSMLDSGYRADAVVIREARSALAAHIKGDVV